MKENFVEKEAILGMRVDLLSLSLPLFLRAIGKISRLLAVKFFVIIFTKKNSIKYSKKTFILSILILFKDAKWQ